MSKEYNSETNIVWEGYTEKMLNDRGWYTKTMWGFDYDEYPNDGINSIMYFDENPCVLRTVWANDKEEQVYADVEDLIERIEDTQ